MIEYSVLPLSLTKKEAYTEASREELMVLLALIESGGKRDEDEIAEAAKISRTRVRSAIVFWEEAEVILKKDSEKSSVTEEFEEKIILGKITERGAEEVAGEIRDCDLADLISECAAMMQKPALSTEETKIITAIYTQLALGVEYIITLAAYMSDKGKLTAQRLGAEAERLVKRGIDCVEELEKYISAKENESGAEWEFKRICGIYNRNLSKRETELVNKWYYTFAFSDEVIGEAYDITVVNTGKLSLPYMDKLLTHWHSEGCLSLEDCKRVIEREKAEKEAEKSAQKPPSIPRKRNTPRYGDFDANDAFAKALLRSYGDEGDKGDGSQP